MSFGGILSKVKTIKSQMQKYVLDLEGSCRFRFTSFPENLLWPVEGFLLGLKVCSGNHGS